MGKIEELEYPNEKFLFGGEKTFTQIEEAVRKISDDINFLYKRKNDGLLSEDDLVYLHLMTENCLKMMEALKIYSIVDPRGDMVGVGDYVSAGILKFYERHDVYGATIPVSCEFKQSILKVTDDFRHCGCLNNNVSCVSKLGQALLGSVPGELIVFDGEEPGVKYAIAVDEIIRPTNELENKFVVYSRSKDMK